MLPETLDDYKDWPDIQRTRDNPFSVDGLICSRCEASLSRLESIFATQFKLQRLDQEPSLFAPFGDQFVFLPQNYQESLFQLFVQSVFYRASIAKFSGVRLDPRTEARIAENLRNAFSVDDFLDARATTPITVGYRFPILAGLYTRPADPTTQYVLATSDRQPYFISAGRWFFELFDSEKQVPSSHQYLYGISRYLPTRTAYEHVKGRPHLFSLNETATVAVHERIKGVFVDKRVANLKGDFRKVFMQVFGFRPSEQIIDYIFFRYGQHLAQDSEMTAMAKAFHDLQLLTD